MLVKQPAEIADAQIRNDGIKVSVSLLFSA
jgi:hypothetical protein